MSWHFFLLIKRKETAPQYVRDDTVFSSTTKFFFANFVPLINFVINNRIF